MTSQQFGGEHGPTITWSALTVTQMMDVLSDLAAYYQMVLAGTGPDGPMFMPNFRKNLRSVKHRPWMNEDPDIVRLASAPSNAANWSTVKKCSKASIGKLEAYIRMSDTDQEAEFNLRGSTLEMSLLGKLRSVPLHIISNSVSGCLRQQHQITPDLVLFWGFVCANSQISIALVEYYTLLVEYNTQFYPSLRFSRTRTSCFGMRWCPSTSRVVPSAPPPCRCSRSGPPY